MRIVTGMVLIGVAMTSADAARASERRLDRRALVFPQRQAALIRAMLGDR